MLTTLDLNHWNSESGDVEKMPYMNVIELALSEFGSKFIMYRKTDGSLRPFVDFIKWNAVTINYGRLISWMDGSIHLIGKLQIILMSDARSGSWKINVDHCNDDKMTLQLHHWLLWFLEYAMQPVKSRMQVPESVEHHTTNCSPAVCNHILWKNLHLLKIQ